LHSLDYFHKSVSIIAQAIPR